LADHFNTGCNDACTHCLHLRHTLTPRAAVLRARGCAATRGPYACLTPPLFYHPSVFALLPRHAHLPRCLCGSLLKQLWLHLTRMPLSCVGVFSAAIVMSFLPFCAPLALVGRHYSQQMRHSWPAPLGLKDGDCNAHRKTALATAALPPGRDGGRFKRA